MAEKSIRDKAFSGIVWSGIDRFAQQLVAMAVRVVLARILFPEDFGLVGLLLVFTQLAGVLQDSGFSVALIRKKEPTQRDFSTIFYFNVGVSLLIYVVFFFSAPLIADFYHQPLLIPLSRVLFLGIILNALGLVQQVHIVRAIDFRKSAIISLSGVIVSGGVAIAMVYAGAGVWSLVAQQVVMGSMRCLLLWVWSDFRPSGGFSGAVVRELFPFSARILLSQVLGQAGTTIYTAIIGKRFSMTRLGYYNEASKYHAIVTDALGATLSTLGLPLFSAVRDERERLQNIFRRMVRVVGFVVFPVMLLMVAAAEPAIELLLTDKWLPAVPLLQLMCFGGMWPSLGSLSVSLLTSEGYSRTLLALGIGSTIAMITSALLAMSYGLPAAVGTWSVVTLISYMVHATLASRVLGLPFLSQLKDIAPYLLLSAGCMLPTMLFQRLVEERWLQLVLQVGIGSGVYLGLCRLLGSKVLRDTQDLVLKKLKIS